MHCAVDNEIKSWYTVIIADYKYEVKKKKKLGNWFLSDRRSLQTIILFYML